MAANISADKLVSLATCFGKFTKTHKFWLHVRALEYLAKCKVRIKPGVKQPFLCGEHVLNSGLGQITEHSRYKGAVVYSVADIPLGFCLLKIAMKLTLAVVVLHQADIGEYVLHEETLT